MVILNVIICIALACAALSLISFLLRKIDAFYDFCYKYDRLYHFTDTIEKPWEWLVYEIKLRWHMRDPNYRR